MSAPLRRISAVLAAAAVVAAAAACSSSKSTASQDPKNGAAALAGSGSVTIRVPDPGNSGALALGKKDGSLAAALAKAGAKVEWTGTAGAFAPAAQELDGDQLDVAEGSITSAVAALAQKPGFKLFAAVAPDKTGEGILVKDGSGINSVADLAGKKVVVWHGGSSEYLLLKALTQNHVPVGSVQRVYLQPNQSAAVLHSGQVDAWSTWATFSISERANAGEHFLVTAGDIGSQNYAVWAVRNEFASKHPAVVKAFYDYLHQAEAEQVQNPEAYINVFRTSGPDAVSGKEKDLTVQDYQAGSPTSPITAADLANFKEVAQFFADQKVTPGVVDLAPNVIDVTTPAGS
ncbi:NrtA/SsuA/CpmA family ABC transporter substrate-binding protein [Catenulispora sp. NF23]|uniref:NrtA/SsuA/CpmA family ABC transporter substrate-binding protein n=1 Tax=Catenulispora pinistramenti TaxID=2705254 RepID=A0ABS5L1L6_9ACTN|nr:NrtA/SsuA/CpmA family ABC transporter substrate-binding protein [Catenulispora pinistramenti]MBS2535775.1 NrtA/SsuA/CpmA family ABC transporter substrate-binding protein [Catenulispora pinistramenti]MBS2552122.1 NrtA/SsuA/CpmA family ABC transporter substrate-binding protein [Catenulispora pinistramenti]